MKLIRSISGIRGIIGQNFNDQIAAEYAKSFSSIQGDGPISLEEILVIKDLKFQMQ